MVVGSMTVRLEVNYLRHYAVAALETRSVSKPVGWYNYGCVNVFITDTCDYADIDECATSNGGCGADASCTNTPGGSTCACLPGYTGDGFTCAGRSTSRLCTNLVSLPILQKRVRIHIARVHASIHFPYVSFGLLYN